VVELPGIEPALEMALNWETLGYTTPRYVRQREITWGNAAAVDGVNNTFGAASVSDIAGHTGAARRPGIE
jgi:hypothetical protein